MKLPMQQKHPQAFEVLHHLLTLKRPYESLEECSVAPYLCGIVPGLKMIDGAGNLHVDTRTHKKHRTLFVAHTDTVHRKGGINNIRTTPAGDAIYASGSQLGADDAAGISVLVAILGKVPGYYIFTRGEEKGGIGSKYLAENWQDVLCQFDRAIAFDRRGTADIITEQMHGVCCSNEFANALSDELNSHGMLYMPSSKGLYTDTAEFIDFIPECTNISVGYANEHSDREWLDLLHLSDLIDASLLVDWDNLPVSRDPDSGAEEFEDEEIPDDFLKEYMWPEPTEDDINDPFFYK